MNDEHSVTFFQYEPGNGGAYNLMYGQVTQSNGRTGHLLVWLHRQGVGGCAFLVMDYFYEIDYGYFMEKTGVDNTADVAALLGFLALAGHCVHMPPGFDVQGRWNVPSPRETTTDNAVAPPSEAT